MQIRDNYQYTDMPFFWRKFQEQGVQSFCLHQITYLVYKSCSAVIIMIIYHNYCVKIKLRITFTYFLSIIFDIALILMFVASNILNCIIREWSLIMWERGKKELRLEWNQTQTCQKKNTFRHQANNGWYRWNKVGWPTSELFTVIFCYLNFAVAWRLLYL